MPFRSPEEEVLPGVLFGREEWVPSPAYWAALAAKENSFEAYISPSGTPLSEDVAFCLLGGHGIKMEINQAAWRQLKQAGFFAETSASDPGKIEEVLRQPLQIEGRQIRYRFPRQRAQRISYALNHLNDQAFSVCEPTALRSALMTLPGIGPKTASWIVRNWTGSDNVAILDIHVVRAGQMMGLFPERLRLAKEYYILEARFLQFARLLGIRASILDALIWREMRALTR
jgi:thermostable 8-oxoguanine DNA glycosylase